MAYEKFEKVLRNVDKLLANPDQSKLIKDGLSIIDRKLEFH